MLEFAKLKWGNSAYHLMMHAFLCDPRFELCKPELVVGVSWVNAVMRHFYVEVRELPDGKAT